MAWEGRELTTAKIYTRLRYEIFRKPYIFVLPLVNSHNADFKQLIIFILHSTTAKLVQGWLKTFNYLRFLFRLHSWESETEPPRQLNTQTSWWLGFSSAQYPLLFVHSAGCFIFSDWTFLRYIFFERWHTLLSDLRNTRCFSAVFCLP